MIDETFWQSDRPYLGEHAARLKDPGQYDEFRRENDRFAKGIHAIWGIKRKPKRTAELQAIRFDAKKFTVAEAKKWLKDHDYKPIVFEPAEEEKNLSQMEVQYRAAEFDRATVDEEGRTAEISFSSEEPVERWFGEEVLDHGSKSVRLARMRSHGPLLVDHDWRDHVGRVEKVSIDSEARKARATVRFGRSERASEIFEDVKDGIRTAVSVGYRVFKMILEKQEEGKPTRYRVSDWEPLEISIVSIPADLTVGVGRGDPLPPNRVEIVREEKKAMEERVEPTVEVVETRSESPPPLIDLAAVRGNAEKAERDRVKTISFLGDRWKQQDLARQAIENGQSLEDFRKVLLERIGQSPAPLTTSAPESMLGMGEKDIGGFRFMRLLRALAMPTDRRAQEDASFEFECSREYAKRIGREPKGVFIPEDVLRSPLRDKDGSVVSIDSSLIRAIRKLQKRDISVGIDTAGGYLVATDLLSGSFIELLRNKALTMTLGTVLDGLQGNIAIPKQTAGGTAYWVSEGGTSTESQQALGQVALTPKTCIAHTDYTRQLMLQSSIAIEAFARDDLASVLALAIDLAAINGSGVAGQPMGILQTSGIGSVSHGADGGAPTWATTVEYETDISVANADVGRLAYLTNSKVRGKMKTVDKAVGAAQFIWDEKVLALPVNGYAAYVTNQVPSDLTKGSGTNLSAMIFGNWADLLVGLWGGLDVLVNPYLLGGGTVRIEVMQSVDVALRHAESFSAAKDIVTT